MQIAHAIAVVLGCLVLLSAAKTAFAQSIPVISSAQASNAGSESVYGRPRLPNRRTLPAVTDPEVIKIGVKVAAKRPRLVVEPKKVNRKITSNVRRTRRQARRSRVRRSKKSSKAWVNTLLQQ